jgi:hypothetical protein
MPLFRKRSSAIQGGIVVAALLFLTACGPTINEQVYLEGKSTILVGIEIIPDFDRGPFNTPLTDFYQFSIVIGGAAQNQSQPRAVYHSEPRHNVVWMALAVDPGAYVLSRTVERARDNLRHTTVSKKSTFFANQDNPPFFEIGPNETVYIGTFRSQLGTQPGLLERRRLGNARKSYEIFPDRARAAMSKFRIPGGPFREINIFANHRNAHDLLIAPWSSRPLD